MQELHSLFYDSEKREWLSFMLKIIGFERLLKVPALLGEWLLHIWD